MNDFVWSRAFAIAKKEVFHIVRDPFTLILAIIFPIFTILVYGFSIDFNLRDIKLAVSDADKTQTSRTLINTFGSSQYFIPKGAVDPADSMKEVQGERAKATLIIPPRFEKDVHAGRTANVQILVDGADSGAVASVNGYVGAIEKMANDHIAHYKPESPYKIKTRFLYNPELSSKWFIIPGLIAVVMAILSIMLTALTVAREWENGSMELLLSTPVKPLEIIIGKLSPYAALGLFAMFMAYLLARAVFNVPFIGSIPLFILGCCLFLIAYLAQGLMISVIARNQQLAMQMAIVSGLLPSNLLSGFVFPIASMPLFFRIVTTILPARWFMNISRNSFLKGAGFNDIWPSFLALALISLLIIKRSTAKFKRDLEP
jgi:ABC-2 type transport system permease protein